MLIDDVKIEVFSGNGGNGRVLFNKTKMALGPTGGDGGTGGAVYLQGVSNIGVLSKFRGKKVYRAENGEMGGDQKKSGMNGKDLCLDVPVGTVVHILNKVENVHLENSFVRNSATRSIYPKIIWQAARKMMVAGNFFFRSASNTTPRECEPGEKGTHLELRLELKLIADVGLIGLPNVGKSTLLNTVTNAKSRVANYAFTTLEPSLGVYFELILADIPGLIEGASTGKGLGVKFLQHVERTNTFFHLISAQSEDPVADYKVIRKELGEYNPELLNREEYVL